MRAPRVPEAKTEQVGAIVVAAGASQRMDGIDKVFALLLDRPLLAHTLQVFQDSPAVGHIVVLLRANQIEEGKRLVQRFALTKVFAVCPGGDRRQDSVSNGLQHLPPCDWVVVHDGARPCVDASLIDRGLAEARETGAAVAAVPAKETMKVVGEGFWVESTPNRERLWAVQTPQVFRYELLAAAYAQAQVDATDDAMLVERLGRKVKVFSGHDQNIKVTAPVDLALAEYILKARSLKES